MSQLDDIKERFKTEAQQIWERFQESSLYNQMSDRYENLSPSAQKGVLWGSLIVVVLMLLSIPMGNFSESSVSIEEFENKRRLIRDLFRVNRDAQNIPQIPTPPPLEMLSNQVQEDLRQAQLVPEQIKSVQVTHDSPSTIKGSLIEGFLQVSLAQLNIRQILDIGHRLQNKLVSVKLKDMDMQANAKDARYFDVVYTLMVMKVPDLSAGNSAPEEESPKPKGRGRK